VTVGGLEPGTYLALLADGDRDALLALGRGRRYQRGEHLMHDGEPGDRVLFLLDGHVKASSTDSRGHEIVLSFRGPGDVLGELTFSHAEPRSSSVVAIEPVEARAATAAELRAFLEQVPTAAMTLIGMHAAIGPSDLGRHRVLAQHRAQRPLDLVLHGALPGLARPAGEVGSVVLQHHAARHGCSLGCEAGVANRWATPSAVRSIGERHL